MHAVEDVPDPRIELCARIDRRNRPVLQVIDNDSPGIPPNVQDKIFFPFFTTKEDRSGIGLSLSRQIMRLHGGALTAPARTPTPKRCLRFASNPQPQTSERRPSCSDSSPLHYAAALSGRTDVRAGRSPRSSRAAFPRTVRSVVKRN